MATYVPAKINTQWIGYSALVSQTNTKIFQQSPTLASGDFKTALDGGTSGNLGTLPTNTPGAAYVKFTLSTSEMNGGNATVMCVDAAGAEWCDLCFNIPTAARQIDDLAFPATSGRSMVVDGAGLVDANMVKMGPTGSGTVQTARDIGLALPALGPGASGGLFISGTNSGNTTVGSFTSSGTFLVNAFTCTNAFTTSGNWLVSGTATWTGAFSATNASNDIRVNLTTIKGQAVTCAAGVTILASVGTAATSTAQTGDCFALIGTAGVGLTSVALAASTSDAVIAGAVWNAATATYGSAGSYGLLIETDLDAAISTRSTLTQTQVTGGAYSIQSASCVLGDARIANLDAAISTRGTSTLTQTQVTGGAYSIQSASCVLGDARIANLDATVSSRSTLTGAQAATATWQDTTAGDFTTANSIGKSLYNSFTAGTSVFTVAALANAPSGTLTAAAIWDLAYSGHTTASTFGALMLAAGSAADPWLTALPGGYASGTAGYLIGTDIPLIKAKTDLIVTSAITVSVPVNTAGTTVTIIQGDSYKAADGRAISFTSVDWPSLIGATVTLRLAGSFDYTFTVTNATTVTRDFTSAETSILIPQTFDFVLRAILSDGDAVTLTGGKQADGEGFIVLPTVAAA